MIMHDANQSLFQKGKHVEFTLKNKPKQNKVDNVSQSKVKHFALNALGFMVLLLFSEEYHTMNTSYDIH